MDKAVTVSPTAEKKQIPHNLPARIQPFVDREQELQQVAQALLDPDIPIVTITGVAGIGKTAMALEVAHRLLERSEFSGGIAWLDCHSANSLDALLAAIQAALRIPPAPTTLVSVRAYLGTQPCLLVLDGYEALAHDLDVLAFLDRLPRRSKALVTSREKVGLVGQERVFEIGTLSEEEGVQLFTKVARRYGVEIPPEDAPIVAEIYRMLSGVPLVITLAAAQTAFIPMDVLRQRIAERGPEVVGLEATLHLTYERLSERGKRLFRRLAVFAGDADEKAIEHVCQVEGWREALAELARFSLVDAKDGRYNLHPVVRQYALRFLEDAAKRRTAEERAAEYFLTLARFAQSKLNTDEAQTAIAIVEAEWANLLAGMAWYQAREGWDKVIAYGYALGELLGTSGHWAERLRVLEWAVAAAGRIRDETHRARLLHNLGIAHQDMGNYVFARRFYEESLKIKKALGDTGGLAATLHQLGMLTQAQGDYPTARRYYEESLKIDRELGDRFGEAQTLSNLAAFHEAQGRWAEAIEMYEQAMSLFRELGDRHGEGQSWANLANVYQLQGRWAEAIELYERALSLFRELGDRHGEGQVLGSLGNVYAHQGHYARAIELYKRALVVFRELGDLQGEAQTLNNLGTLTQTQADYSAALRYFEESLEIAEALGDKVGVATTVGQVGQLAEAEGDHVTAIRSWVRAFGIFSELGSPNRETVASWTARLRDRLGEAAFQQIWQEADVEIPPEVLGLRRAEPADRLAHWVNLGRRHEQEQNWPAAIEAYQQARALFDPTEMTEEERRYAEISFRLGVCLKQAGRWSEALMLQRENFEAFRQMGDFKGQGDTYMEIGHLNQLLSNYEEAWLHYLDAYRLYRRANGGQGEKLGMAAASEALGTLEFYARMLPQAVQDLDDARMLYLSQGLSGSAALVEQTLETARKALREQKAPYG